jgi:hypothetical protein
VENILAGNVFRPGQAPPLWTAKPGRPKEVQFSSADSDSRIRGHCRCDVDGERSNARSWRWRTMVAMARGMVVMVGAGIR